MGSLSAAILALFHLWGGVRGDRQVPGWALSAESAPVISGAAEGLFGASLKRENREKQPLLLWVCLFPI